MCGKNIDIGIKIDIFFNADFKTPNSNLYECWRGQVHEQNMISVGLRFIVVWWT